MTSEVEICNVALSHFRGGSINSLTESSTQAQYCKLFYPLLRDQMLQDSQWQFATSIKPLSLTTTEVFNWAYVYQYPSDCLYINRLIRNCAQISQPANGSSAASRGIDTSLPVVDLDQQIDYRVYNVDGQRVIVANEPDLRIDYRVKITDPNMFSTNFVMALSHLLSAEMAVPIVGAEKGRAFRADSLKMYESYIASGVANELNEQYSRVPDSEYITVR